MRHYLCLLIYYMMLSITHYGPEICMEKQLRGQLDKKKYINLKLKKNDYITYNFVLFSADTKAKYKYMTM